MTKSTLLSAVAVFSLTLTAPAMAQHVVAHPNSLAQTGVCPGRDAGNPYTKEEDYLAWSGWRARGGWDDRNDFNCLRSVHGHHHEVGF